MEDFSCHFNGITRGYLKTQAVTIPRLKYKGYEKDLQIE